MRILCCLLFGLMFYVCSCSLEYGSNNQEQDIIIPEYSFLQAEFTQYESGKASMTMIAAGIEQYRDDDVLYGTDITFSVYDDDGSISADGVCDLLSADTNTESYILSGGISVTGYKEQLSFTGERLRWNGESEQLTGATDDVVSIVRQGDSRVSVVGSGFAASGVSRTYVFSGAVSGVIETDE